MFLKIWSRVSGEEEGVCCLVLLTSLTEPFCLWIADVRRECVYSFHKGVEARVASQGQPGSQALHLTACQETLQSWKNVWTLPSLWFKGCPGFCLGRCDTIYTGSRPAGAEWAGKHQQIFHPKAQKKNTQALWEQRLQLFQAPVDKNSGEGEILHKFVCSLLWLFPTGFWEIQINNK